MIGRYDNVRLVSTPLDPLEDVASWILTLGSTGYTADLLREVHGHTKKAEIKRSATSIGILASSAVGFIDQAYAGPAEISFLPLYYALLDLSKIYIIAAGRRADLQRQRTHGASYNPAQKRSHRLFTERIKLHQGGVFPLFYETLTGQRWRHNGRQLQAGEFYPFIAGISHEYSQLYSRPADLQFISVAVERSPSSGFFLVAQIYGQSPPKGNYLRYLKVLHGFRTRTNGVFVSPVVHVNDAEAAESELLRYLNRFLFYDSLEQPAMFGVGMTRHFRVPVSARTFLWPEEVPIWLCFFHLSSVVRYNPEFMHKLTNDKAWGLLLAARKHAILRSLILTWAFCKRRNTACGGIIRIGTTRVGGRMTSDYGAGKVMRGEIPPPTWIWDDYLESILTAARLAGPAAGVRGSATAERADGPRLSMRGGRPGYGAGGAGNRVIGVELNDELLDEARARNRPTARIRRADLSEPLDLGLGSILWKCSGGLCLGGLCR